MISPEQLKKLIEKDLDKLKPAIKKVGPLKLPVVLPKGETGNPDEESLREMIKRRGLTPGQVWEEYKESVLTGAEIEEGIKPLTDAINSFPYLVTTSSCEGHTLEERLVQKVDFVSSIDEARKIIAEAVKVYGGEEEGREAVSREFFIQKWFPGATFQVREGYEEIIPKIREALMAIIPERRVGWQKGPWETFPAYHIKNPPTYWEEAPILGVSKIVHFEIPLEERDRIPLLARKIKLLKR